MGLNVPVGSFWFMMALIILENVILWTIIAAVSSWIAKKVKKH